MEAWTITSDASAPCDAICAISPGGPEFHDTFFLGPIKGEQSWRTLSTNGKEFVTDTQTEVTCAEAPPTVSPTLCPTSQPTVNPTTKSPTNDPTSHPSQMPTYNPMVTQNFPFQSFYSNNLNNVI